MWKAITYLQPKQHERTLDIMKALLCWWYGLEFSFRFYFNIAAAVILPILYFLCKRLQKRWAWWAMLICVFGPLLLGLATFAESIGVVPACFDLGTGSTVSWGDAIISTVTNTVFILVFGFTITHCFPGKEKTKS